MRYTSSDHRSSFVSRSHSQLPTCASACASSSRLSLERSAACTRSRAAISSSRCSLALRSSTSASTPAVRAGRRAAGARSTSAAIDDVVMATTPGEGLRQEQSAIGQGGAVQTGVAQRAPTGDHRQSTADSAVSRWPSRRAGHSASGMHRKPSGRCCWPCGRRGTRPRRRARSPRQTTTASMFSARVRPRRSVQSRIRAGE